MFRNKKVCDYIVRNLTVDMAETLVVFPLIYTLWIVVDAHVGILDCDVNLSCSCYDLND